MTSVESLVSYGSYFYALAIASTIVDVLYVILAPRLNRLIKTSSEEQKEELQTA